MPFRSLFVALLGTVLTLVVAAPAEAASYELQEVSMPDGSTEIARWDPCETISYRVSVRGIKNRKAQWRAVKVTKRSVARLGAEAGLDFVFEGRTRYIPRKSNSSRQPAELVIGFVRPRQTDYPLAGATAGYGGWRGSYSRSGSASDGWAMEITRGFVVLDHLQTHRWPNRLDRRGVTRPNLITHELGHAIGLGHVSDRREIMNDHLHSRSPIGFGRGDRLGLREVGAAAGCV